MVPEPVSAASAFASRPTRVGRALLVAGLLVVAATFFLPTGDAAAITRGAGLALMLVGGLAHGFGRLLHSANRSPRERDGAPHGSAP